MNKLMDSIKNKGDNFIEDIISNIDIDTIRQRKLILSIINEKAGLNLSYGNLERKDFSIYRRRKKK